MAKKGAVSGSGKAKNTPKAKAPIQVTEDDSSDGFSSSDEDDVQMNGDEQPSGKSSHSVNITKASKADETEVGAKKRAIIYIGNLPKRMEEPQLKKYFNQFGAVLRVRVSRNKTTGAPRGYAYIEFKELSAAQVAQETMNNYLIFGQMLKVDIVDDPKNHLFSSKMKSSFREFNWRKKLHDENNAPKPLKVWQELQKQFEESKEKKFAELKELGFNYELEA